MELHRRFVCRCKTGMVHEELLLHRFWQESLLQTKFAPLRQRFPRILLEQVNRDIEHSCHHLGRHGGRMVLQPLGSV